MCSEQQRYFDLGNRLTSDSCAILAREYENQSILDYMTFNPIPISCDKEISQVAELASCHPNLRFKSGYGNAPSCRIDADSQVRYQQGPVRTPEKQQLSTRVFQAAPNLAKGSCAPNTESYLLSSSDTSINRDCAELAERNYDRFTPFITCVQNYLDGYAQSVGSVNTVGVSSRDQMRMVDAQRQCMIGRS